ncbi:MAG: chromosomal replication initiator protein DnaA [Alphaproteobacteria bacterium]
MADAKKVERRTGRSEIETTASRVPGSGDLEAKWQAVQARLKVSLGAHTFNSWISSLRFVEMKGGRVTLAAPSIYRRNHVAAQFQERIWLHWRSADASVSGVEIIVDPTARGALAHSNGMRPPIPVEAQAPGHMRPSRLRPNRPGQTQRLPDFVADCAPDPQHTFDRFVVGPSNQLAFAAAERVAKEPSANYNPFYLYCPSGFGKTHLVSAIGREAMRINPQIKVAYVPAEKFMIHYSSSARDGETNAFREMIRAVDLLILDDLQFICSRPQTLREFIQTFSALVSAGKRVVITADRPAAKIEDIDEHVRSRLSSGLTVSMEAPDYDLRLAILKRKLADRLPADRRHFVPDNCLELIAHKVDTNPRELEAALKCVTANCELMNRPISLEMTQEFVKHLVRTADRRITIEEIQKEVSSFYGVSMRDLLSHRRDRQIVRPRQIAMFLAKELTTRSLPEIGRRFGGRDHTTVLYGVRKIGEMREENQALADEIDLLKRMIES